MVEAVGTYIIIEKNKNPEVAPSGLQFSEVETNKMRAHRATVISCGSEVSGIEKGDDIYFDKARAFEQIIDGVERTLIRVSDVIVIIRHDEADES